VACILRIPPQKTGTPCTRRALPVAPAPGRARAPGVRQDRPGHSGAGLPASSPGGRAFRLPRGLVEEGRGPGRPGHYHTTSRNAAVPVLAAGPCAAPLEPALRAAAAASLRHLPVPVTPSLNDPGIRLQPMQRG
jgi:hypothetical protein